MQSLGTMSVSESQPLSGKLVRTGAWPGLRCHDVVYEPHLRLTAHEHELPFFALSLCGAYDESTGGKSYSYSTGAALFHAAHEEHAVRIAGAAARCFVIEIDGVEQRFDCSLPSSMPQPAGEAASILSAMYAEFRRSDVSSALSLQGLLLQLIASISRNGTEARCSRPAFLERVEEFLRSHFRSQLTLEEIATAVGAAPARLSSVFRAVHGHSLADEQRRLRIEHACRRMLDPTTSLAEIAVECGFADQAHFSRAFLRVKGMTPSRYRALLR